MPFTEEEVTRVIMDMPGEKAPGPDGYIGRFYKSAWEIIKPDVMTAVNLFYRQHSHQLNLLNSGHVVLIPKHADAKTVGDYRPISLPHSMAKLISKLMANRLGTRLDSLVSRSQSAFIKRRCIYDNFLYTQNLIRELFREKKSQLYS